MMPDALLGAAVLIIACLLSNRVFGRLGMPTLLAFLGLGMLCGSDGLLKIAFDDFALSEQVSSVALIFIIFYGGFWTNWRLARPVVGKAVLLSSAGVVLTAVLVGAFCHWALGMPPAESLLVGALISSTDAASVFSILRAKRLNLRYGTASMLEMESGSNDCFSYMLTVVILAFMGGSAQSPGAVAWMLGLQIVAGALCGVGIALAARYVLQRVSFSADGFDALFMLAVALLSYTVPQNLGGNGYLSAYLAGMILGNSPLPNKRSLLGFFDGLTGLMQMVLFFLLGLLSFPSQLPAVAWPATLIALFLTFVARPLSVALLLTPLRCPFRQQALVAWTGLRGAASIVFAIVATINPAHTYSDIFHTIFFIVLLSVLFQGTLLPWVARRLDMIDDDEDVRKTFNDYDENAPLTFAECTLKEGSPWVGRFVRDLDLPPDTLLALVQREGRSFAPDGNTRLQAGDVLVLGGREVTSISSAILQERRVEEGSPLAGRPLREAPADMPLVVAVLRGQGVLIPRGDTVLQEGDILVVCEEE